MNAKEIIEKRNEAIKHIEAMKDILKELHEDMYRENRRRQRMAMDAIKTHEDEDILDAALENATICRLNIHALSHAIRTIDSAWGFVNEVSGTI